MIDRADIDALIEDADEQLERVRELYEESLRGKEVPPKLRTRIKNVLENQRSALEYLAHAIWEAHGDSKGRSYYPVANSPKEFPSCFNNVMSGVAMNCPDVRDAIEKRQPYQPGYEWLTHLSLLTNENKHRRLTPQTRDETRWIETGVPGGGGVGFRPYQEGKGGVTFGGRVFMGGTEVDPKTLEPVGGGPKPYTETIYVDWLFEDPPLSALRTLERIQDSLPSLVDDVLSALP